MAAQMLEEDALRFDAFLKENDEKVQEAIKKAEAEAKAKQDKVRVAVFCSVSGTLGAAGLLSRLTAAQAWASRHSGTRACVTACPGKHCRNVFWQRP